jgi:hypothetical protein
MPYRDNARWGDLVSTHRASIISWVIALPIGIGGLILMARFAAKGGPGALKLGIGAAFMAVLSVWVIVEIVKLRRIVLRIYERGFAFTSAREHHELEWGEIAGVEAQHVPGALGLGADDPGNLVALVVSGPQGTFSLPKELSHFRDIVETVHKHTTAPWVDTVIASLVQRS